MATKQEIIKNWMENIADNEEVVDIVREVNLWDGSLQEYEFYYMDTLNEFFGDCRVTDFLEKLAPNFNVSSDGYRDTYHGLESCSIEEAVDDIKDNIDDIVEAIVDAMEETDLYLPSELKELLEEG